MNHITRWPRYLFLTNRVLNTYNHHLKVDIIIPDSLLLTLLHT